MKEPALEGAAGFFGSEAKAEAVTATVDVETLHAKIGELTLENDFFGRRAHKGGTAERKAMIDPEHDLPIKQQAELLGISRSTVVANCLTRAC